MKVTRSQVNNACATFGMFWDAPRQCSDSDKAGAFLEIYHSAVEDMDPRMFDKAVAAAPRFCARFPMPTDLWQWCRDNPGAVNGRENW